MIICYKCRGAVFIDRCESSVDHLEIYCVMCGMRKVFHPPSRFGRSVQWLHQVERKFLSRANGL